MSNRNHNGRLERFPQLSENDRVILNIYLNMYNQTVRDIDLLYQQVDLMYENLNSIRNIINFVTGVSDSLNQTTEQEPRPSTFARSTSSPTNNSHYSSESNNLSLSNRFHLVELARDLLDSYDRETEMSNQYSREIGERERTRVRRRVAMNTIRRPSTPIFNAESINLDSIATGISQRIFPNLNSFYDNVPVYPTTEQVTNGTRRLLYSDLEEEPLNLSCPITLERFESDNEVLQILGCNHIFNPTSLEQWFRSNVRCPICRYDIREYVPITNGPRRNNFYQEEAKEEEIFRSYSSESSDSTLRSPSPEPCARNSIPEPTDNTEFISNLTTVTENLLNDLFSSSFPNNQFNFNGTTYSVDMSNNEIVFQGYVHPNNRDL